MALGRKVVAATVCGEQVHIRSLNGGPIAVRAIELMGEVGKRVGAIAELGALMVVACKCNEIGQREYTDDQVDQVREDASIGFLKEFTEQALEISGLSDDAEQVRKNSEAGQ